MTHPTKVVLHRRSQELELIFDQTRFLLSAEYLRVSSPSAEVKGHGPGQEVLQLNKHDVKLTRLEPQGRYGIRLHFDDGHNTGIYSWDYLYELGLCHEANMAAYRDKVAKYKESEGHTPLRWVTPNNQGSSD